MKKLNKKELKDLILTTFANHKMSGNDLKKLTSFYNDLQGLYIEIVERQQLKGGRNIYGGFPYALLVTVYELKDNKINFKGSGIATGDYASHKGIENAGLDCIYKLYNNNNYNSFYLHSYKILEALNVNLRIIDKGYNGRYTEEPFKWHH